MNKKVKNAQPIEFNNIKFRSKLEMFCYSEAKKLKLNILYEPDKVVLLPAFEPKNLTVITPKKVNGKYKLLHYYSKIRALTYTPDFVVHHKDYIIFIETKGRPNDTYPLKKKLFLNYCEKVLTKKLKKHIVFMEPHNQTQVLECLDLIINEY